MNYATCQGFKDKRDVKQLYMSLLQGKEPGSYVSLCRAVAQSPRRRTGASTNPTRRPKLLQRSFWALLLLPIQVPQKHPSSFVHPPMDQVAKGAAKKEAPAGYGLHSSTFLGSTHKSTERERLPPSPDLSQPVEG